MHSHPLTAEQFQKLEYHGHLMEEGHMLRLKFNSTSISLMGVAALLVGLTSACADYKSENQEGIGTISAPGTDSDNDSVANDIDNCPLVVNPDQKDIDDDGIGDACDDDLDGDGVPNGEDNCRWWPNQDQTDTDIDGVGDACDNDDDDDGVCDRGLDRLPPGQIQEGQAECDGQDNCPWVYNPGQDDLDHDGWGDICDNDWDSDHVLNGVDNCPMVPNQLQLNLDGDKFGDACDDDLDGDGVPNGEDNCPTLWVQGIDPMDLSSQSDCDGDGKGDLCDLDFDNDGQPEVRDEFAFPNWATCPENGNCTVETQLTDCDDDNNCTADSCDSESRKCMHEPTNEEGSCDDNNACTENDWCDNGECVGGESITCDDGNTCTDDSCDPMKGCVYINNADDCNDNNACTENDACSEGTCSGTTKNCDDGNTCTDDSCDPMKGCVYTNNSAPCDDGLYCDGLDTCGDGTCSMHAGDPCLPLVTTDSSCANSCDEEADSCTAPDPNGTACNDGSACTTGDQCTGGVCGGTQICLADNDHDGYPPCEGPPAQGNTTCDCDDNGTDNVGVASYCRNGPDGFLMIKFLVNDPASRPACPEGSTLVGTTDGSFLNGPQISGHDTQGDAIDNDCDGSTKDGEGGLNNCTFVAQPDEVTYQVDCPWMDTAPTLPPAPPAP